MQNAKRMGKASLVFAASLLLLIVLAGCSSNDGTDSKAAGKDNATGKPEETKPAAAEPAEREAPLPVNVMTIFYGNAPVKDSEVEKQIEAAVRANLNIEWVSSNNYSDKLNVVLASGSIPELITITDPFTSAFRSAVAQGAFWDLTDYVKDYANIQERISETAWKLSSMQDGRNYGVPRPRPTGSDGILNIRKDWLDKLSLQVPTTTDELYTVLKAFKDGDPDGNNRADTIPWATMIDEANLLRILDVFNGSVFRWKETGGKLSYTPLSSETTQGLAYLARLFEEGLIPQDVASLQSSQVKDMFMSGKAGSIMDKAGTAATYIDPLRQIEPNVTFAAFEPIPSLNGFSVRSNGFAGIIAIPKSVPEEKMKRILGMIDTWMTDETYDIQKFGIEGVHYKLENGEKIVDSEKYNADGIGNFNQIGYISAMTPADQIDLLVLPDDVKVHYKNILIESDKASVPDYSVGLYSETGQIYLPELEKKIEDLYTKVILGIEPLSAWEQYAEALKNDEQLAKVIKEMNDAYAMRLGN